MIPKGYSRCEPFWTDIASDIRKGMTIAEVAEKYGFTPRIIRDKCNNEGLPLPRQKPPNRTPNRDAILDDIDKGELSLEDIALKWNVKLSTIKEFTKKLTSVVEVTAEHLQPKYVPYYTTEGFIASDIYRAWGCKVLEADVQMVQKWCVITLPPNWTYRAMSYGLCTIRMPNRFKIGEYYNNEQRPELQLFSIPKRQIKL